jgi:hypothetical protein
LFDRLAAVVRAKLAALLLAGWIWPASVWAKKMPPAMSE